MYCPMRTEAEVAATIAGFRCRRGIEVSVFARDCVTRFGPTSKARAKALLWSCGRLGAFGAQIGLRLAPEVLLAPWVIERLVLVGVPDLSPAARRTLRTNLRAVSARLLGVGPEPNLIGRERAKTAYTPAQIAAYLALADAQPTVRRRMRAQGLICLGAGAGLTGVDLRALRGVDVARRSGGLVVEVTGRRARVVPVLAEFAERLETVAAWAGERFIVGGVDPDRRNVTTPLIASLSGGGDLGRLELARLRVTWLTRVADRIGLKALLDAAGITCSQRLGDIVAGLPSPSEHDAMVLLGAAH